MTDDSASSERRPAVPAEPTEPTEPTEPLRIGAALAEARTARGLSVEDVAASTRIRATLIRAIESDDFSRCGGAVYARGHIKSIAQVVGADAHALVAEFDRQHDNPVPTLTATPLPAFEPAVAARRPSAPWATAAIAVMVIAVVFLAVSWIAGRGNSSRDGGGGLVQGTTVPTSSAAPSQPPSTPPASTSPRTSQPPKGVSLRVRAIQGESWLRVTGSSGEQVYQGILTAGRAMDFRDGQALTVRFGNARVVTLTLNGRDLGAPRCGAYVCTMRFAPNSQSAG